MSFARVFTYMVPEMTILLNAKEYYKLSLLLQFLRGIGIWKRKSMCFIFFFFSPVNFHHGSWESGTLVIKPEK